MKLTRLAPSPMSKHRTFLTALTPLLLSLATSVFAIDVQGHRGARTVLPENSLPAFKYALELGVDTLELDTGISKDGVVVVVHDQKINTTLCQYKDGTKIRAKARKTLWVHQLTLKQIKLFDCGSRINPRFRHQTLLSGTEIPTLKEVFDLVKNSAHSNAKTVQFNIETKSDPRYTQAQPEPKEFAKRVLNLVTEYGFQDRATIQSFDHRTLVAASELYPNIKRAALYHENLSDWVTPTLAAKASIVSPKYTNLTAKEVLTIHKAGLTVIPWTANTEKAWKKLIDMKVDGIITDDPEPLLNLLRRNGKA